MSFFLRSWRSKLGTPTFLTAGIIALAAQQGQAQTVITVNENNTRATINQNIYGANYVVDYTTSNNASSPTTSDVSGMNLRIVRKGGNVDSTYNWQQDVFNHGLDYYFEVFPDQSGYSNGQTADAFISQIQGGGASPVLTIPMLDYISKAGTTNTDAYGPITFLYSFSHNKYGYTYSSYDTGTSVSGLGFDIGNGVIGTSGTGHNVYQGTNNPNDANTPNSVSYQQQWMSHLLATHGSASTSTGVQYYILDNEPDDWQDEHADVVPVGVTLNGYSPAGIPASSGMENRLESYSAMVKTADPNAVVIGPEIGGSVWYGYFESGYDLNRYNQFGDGSASEFQTYSKGALAPQLLSDLNAYDTAHSKKTLDIFSVHFYPQSGEYSGTPSGDDVSTSMQHTRNKTTRVLWDNTYADPNFSGSGFSDGAGSGVVQLFPALRGWVAKNYAGLQTGLTEYSWGADLHMNGATAQADILGIMGRGITVNGQTYTGLDFASRFTTPATNSPTFKAFQMYRNYDGSNSGFGNISVSCTTNTSADNVSAFAANTRNSLFLGHTLTVMVVNKNLPTDANSSVPIFINANLLANCFVLNNTTASVYQLAAVNGDPTNAAITHLPSIAVTKGNRIQTTVPAQSVTIFSIPVYYTWQWTVHVPITFPIKINKKKAANIPFEAKFYDHTTGALIDDAQGLYTDENGDLVAGTSYSGTFDIVFIPQGGLTTTYKNVTLGSSNPNVTLSAATILQGDVNGDNSVDLVDYAAVLKAYGKTYLDAGFNPALDVDGDGVIDANDLAIIKANLHQKGN